MLVSKGSPTRTFSPPSMIRAHLPLVGTQRTARARRPLRSLRETRPWTRPRWHAASGSLSLSSVSLGSASAMASRCEAIGCVDARGLQVEGPVGRGREV